jgi:hypothetical protein
MVQSDKAFNLTLGETRVVTVPDFRIRFDGADGECIDNFEYSVKMTNGSDLIVSIRYYPDSKEIHFIPHATTEVGTHEVTIKATQTLDPLGDYIEN